MQRCTCNYNDIYEERGFAGTACAGKVKGEGLAPFGRHACE